MSLCFGEKKFGPSGDVLRAEIGAFQRWRVVFLLRCIGWAPRLEEDLSDLEGSGDNQLAAAT